MREINDKELNRVSAGLFFKAVNQEEPPPGQSNGQFAKETDEQAASNTGVDVVGRGNGGWQTPFPD